MPPTPTAVERAWRAQSVWSQVAGRLKADIQRYRRVVLALSVAGAVLSAAAVVAGLDSGAGKVLAGLSGAAVALAGLARARTARDAVRSWTRARSVAEAIKSEVYVYLVGIGEYERPDRDTRLDVRVEQLEDSAADLLAHKVGIEARQGTLPAVRDLATYIESRVDGQIREFYRPRADELQRKLRRVRRAGDGLAVGGVLVAAAAAVTGSDPVAVWVPVLTSVGTAVTAYAAAERYDYLLVEYLRTAEELERLRDRRGAAAQMTGEQLVRAAEHVISVQNEGWMAKLGDENGKAPPVA
jgi:SMODS and SLOG-associating 2TM effector domain 1/Protein of unknown function (DUF4231)